MKTVSPELKNHLRQELTTLASLIKITRIDNSIVALTSHDQDIFVGDILYKADGALTAIGDVEQTSVSSGHSLDIEGVLDSDLISEEDIKAGQYDHARIDISICNWSDLTQGTMHLRRGWIGEVILKEGAYEASFVRFHDLLNAKVGETYTPECRYSFGETRCGVDCDAYKVTGSVSAVIDRRRFEDSSRYEEDGLFKDGQLSWVSGANAGFRQEVSSWDLTQQRFTSWLAAPYEISVGDSYEVTYGCDKRFETCKNRFNNAANFGGFPHLPGTGKLLSYPS